MRLPSTDPHRLKGSRGPDLRRPLTALSDFEDRSAETIKGTVTTCIPGTHPRLSRGSLTKQRLGTSPSETLAALRKPSSTRRIKINAEPCEGRALRLALFSLTGA